MTRPQNPTHADFVTLLNLCLVQVQADPDAFRYNPHLYDMLYSIYLRLCGGDTIENAVGGIHGPETRR
jgi:hypothetical protein